MRSGGICSGQGPLRPDLESLSIMLKSLDSLLKAPGTPENDEWERTWPVSH